MKKNFFAGLAALLPIALTVMIANLLVNIVTAPFVGTIFSFFNYYDIFDHSFHSFQTPEARLWATKVIALVLIIAITAVVGFMAQLLVLRYIGQLGDYLFHRIPGINKIYKAIQDVAHTLFVKNAQQTTAFSHVVLVPFPHAKTYSVGLITNPINEMHSTDSVSVFVPGTPNPAMGFMLIFPKSQVIPLNYKVEEALKFLISCGVVSPTSNTEGLGQDISGK